MIARVLRMNENVYYWPAINAGIRASHPSTRYYLALNDDIIVLGKEWIQRLIEVVESDAQVGYAGEFRANPSFKPLGGFVDGYCAIFRKELFDEVGLFDERRPFHWGFVDFQLRAYRRGYRGADIKKPGDVQDRIEGVVHHLRGRTILPISDQLSEVERMRLFGSRWTPLRILFAHHFYRSAASLLFHECRGAWSRARQRMAQR